MTGRLDQKRVLVTRPRERSEELCFLLEDEGAEVVSMPLLELLPPDNDRPLRSAAEHLHQYAWVLFTSPKAVAAWVEATREAGTLDRLREVKLGAVGPMTARALEDFGLPVHARAEHATGEGLFEAVRQSVNAGDEVLLPVAAEGRPELNEALEAIGVRVARVVAYRSARLPIDPEVLSGLEARPPDAVLFGSPRTAEAYLEATGEVGRGLLERSKRVAIGPTTARALTELGFAPAAVAEDPTATGLVEATVRALSSGA